MKNFVKIIAVILIAAISMTFLVSCFKSMNGIEKKIKDLDEDEYTYEKLSSKEINAFIDGVADEYDYEFKGDVKSYYTVIRDFGYRTAMICELEKTADAKELVKIFEEELELLHQKEEESEKTPDVEFGVLVEYKKYVVKRSGKIVVFGHEDIVKEIW